MKKQFEILQTLKLKPNQSLQDKNIAFKVQWQNSKEIAFINFDLLKSRYPSILLEYLISRIQLKPSKKQVLFQKQDKTVSPITHEQQFRMQEQKTPLQQYLTKSYKRQKQIAHIFDYDGLKINNFATPVHFRVQSKQEMGKQRKKSKRKIVKIKKNIDY